MIPIMLANGWTSVLGVLSGMLLYLTQHGATIPRTKAEWGSLLLAALLAGLGIASKDATTGSAPIARP